MKTIRLISFVIILFSSHLLAQTTNFHMTSFQLTSPGAMKYGLYGYDNPAILSALRQPDIQFMWTDDKTDNGSLRDWGIFTGMKNFGFNVIHTKVNEFSATDYKMSAAAGNEKFSLGFAYNKSEGNSDELNHFDYYSVGFLFRPVKYISAGITGSKSVKTRDNEAYFDLAVRPLGNELISIFADYIINNVSLPGIKKSMYSAGAAIEVTDGLRICGRYFETKQFTAGIQLGLGNLGFSAQSHFDNNSKHAFNSYGIRIGSYDRNLISKIFSKNEYAKIDLKGRIKYQRYRLFDKSNTLRSLIDEIEAARADNNIAGIAINTSGLSASREMLWEIREKLSEFKTSGKKIVVFIDNPGIDVYHFASVADKIVMDPLGMINLQGYILGMTYYKGTLEKLGIGFEEWRFFKFKSALESLARDNMSPADSVQRQELVDAYYNTAKKGITEDRKISSREFDEIVDSRAIITAKMAKEISLVDTLGRWSDAEKIISELSGKKSGLTEAGSIAALHLPEDNHWGGYNKIAVIYAIGNCAMDEGINARELVKDVEAAGKDDNIKAIVLRVDSPGGDAMASDYIAEAIKTAKEKKPVVISQGAVAASGGYWLSMYGSRILAAPNTITGSIGVIGGWAYNMGIKEKLGFTTDYVKHGGHADLGFGMTVPLLGIQLPDRNLSDIENIKMRGFILGFYEDFVARVAAGRKLSTDFVDSVGQGRVWSGMEGLKLNLVDEEGGLDRAVKVAKEMAGIEKNEKVKIIEFPKPPMIDLSFLSPKIFGVIEQKTSIMDDLLFRFKHNGQPLTILPIEYTQMIQTGE